MRKENRETRGGEVAGEERGGGAQPEVELGWREEATGLGRGSALHEF